MSVILNVCGFVCLFAIVYGLERGDLEKYGPFRLVLNSPVIKCAQNRNLNLDVSGINVHFYDFATKKNSSFPIKMAASHILNTPDLNKTKKFIMFVGGFKSQIHKSIEEQIRHAYRRHPNSYLIIPDHSLYTHDNDGGIKSYERSVLYVHYIGTALGQMWADISREVNPDNMHLIGHSLGGQMLGHAGNVFQLLTGKKIARITALDPAGPCFTKYSVEDQIRSGVAKYVEVYHSNAGALGSSSVLGDVDYFINNGEAQPGCKMPIVPVLFDSSRAASCNHRVVIDVWTASVKNKELFPAIKCHGYKQFLKGDCKENNKTIAGAHSNLTAKGIYYLSTKEYDLELIK